MKLELIRYNHDTQSTSGLLMIDGKFECYTLEDERHDEKVRGETRIPEGTYTVGWQEVITGLTETYRKKYPWFDKHLHIKNIPNYEGVYIHIGNYEKDTDGCPLVADQAVNDPNDYASHVLSSTTAMQRMYAKVQKALTAKEPVTITVKSI